MKCTLRNSSFFILLTYIISFSLQIHPLAIGTVIVADNDYSAIEDLRIIPLIYEQQLSN